MELDWVMLANYAEAPAGTGFIYISGGGVDTIRVVAPLEGGPPGVVGAANVYLAMRLLFHTTELGRERDLDIRIMDEDGGEVAKIEGNFTPEAQAEQPPHWRQGFHLIFPLLGMPLPRFGLFTVNIQV